MKISPENAERCYLELAELLQATPDLSDVDSRQVHRWLAAVQAIIEEAPRSTSDLISCQVAANNLDSFALAETNQRNILKISERVLARLERLRPSSRDSGFLSAGEPFSALVTIGKVLASAQDSVLFIDPYASMVILKNFALLAPENVSIHILAGKGQVKNDLGPSSLAWKDQFGSTRELEVRLAPKGTVHDRAIIIDDKAAWSLGTSFNGIAKRSPSLIQKVDPIDVFPDKLAAYRALWSEAESLS